MTFSATQRVGEIVAAFPGASNLFKAYGIDFCCGGGRSLEVALQEKGVAPGTFLSQLQAAYETYQRRMEGRQTDWRTVPLEALIEQIITAHHQYLRQELPVLSAFTVKIAHVHGERHPELITLQEQFHTLKAELESHMADEEERLFPLVRAYEESGSREDLTRALATLEELEAEHQAAGSLLAAMRATTADYLLPPDACRTYTLAFHKLEELESDMFQHIHLENNILFERLRAAAG
ncbi:MAG: iron-sulfur cluster repair di-iron protein [Pseudomonadota bacterium]